MKKPLQIRVEDETIEALKEQAKEDKRSLSSHCNNVLTKHVQKQEVRHTPKKNYGRDNHPNDNATDF